MTNGDKIRAMTDHELAELIEALVGCDSPLCKDCQAETGAADCQVIVDGNFVSDCRYDGVAGTIRWLSKEVNTLR